MRGTAEKNVNFQRFFSSIKRKRSNQVRMHVSELKRKKLEP